MKRHRIALIAVGALVLLLGGLALAVALIPEERVADAAAARAEEVLGQPVAIDRVGLSLFPLPGVRLSRVAIGPDTARLARVHRAKLRVRLLPLFGGRVVVRTFDLEAPEIAVEIDTAGITNFPVLEPDTTEPSGDVTFSLDRVRVTDGRIRYVNRESGTRVLLDGWTQELAVAGAVEEGELRSLTLAGEVEFDHVDASLAGAVLPARDLRLAVRHDATLDLAADVLELRELQVDMDGVAMTGNGRVEGVNSGRPGVHLELAADGLHAGRLMAWVPDSLQDRLVVGDRSIGLAGTATLRATVDGIMAPDTLPDVNGLLTLADGAVTLGNDAILEQIDGRVHFSLDSAMARLDGRALGGGFNAGVAVRDPARPLAVVAISGGGQLGRLQELGLLPDTLGLTGDLQIDLRTQVPFDDPAASRARGTVAVSGVVAAGLDPVVRVPTASARFDGGDVAVSPFRVELGPERSEIGLELTATQWIPAMIDSTAPPPDVTVAMEARSLDMDDVFGPSDNGYPALLFGRLRDRPVDGRPAAVVAEEMGLGVPTLPRVDARVDARIGELIRNGLRYTDLVGRIRVTPAMVEVQELQFGLMGGTVDLAGTLETLRTDEEGKPLESRVTGRYGLTDVGAGPFFDRLSPFRDHLAGQLAMAGTTGMTLDRYALPRRPTVQAEGSLAISDGRMASWAVLRNVMDRLNVVGFDTLWFRDWAGRYRIDGTRVHLDETALQGDDLGARAAGWFDFGGEMDVTVTALLSPDLAGRAGAIGEQLLAATDGGVPVGLRLQGNVGGPDVSLDLSPVRDAVAGRAREAAEGAAGEAEARAREAAEDAAERLGDRAAREAAERFELPDSLRDLPADSLRAVLGDSAYRTLPDSVKVRADSLQKSIENAIRERLRRLLPGGGGGDEGDEGGGTS